MKLDPPPPHSVSYEREIIEGPPQKGWRQYEPTPNARASCTCGELDTGYVGAAEAEQAAREHVAAYLPGVPFDREVQP